MFIRVRILHLGLQGVYISSFWSSPSSQSITQRKLSEETFDTECQKAILIASLSSPNHSTPKQKETSYSWSLAISAILTGWKVANWHDEKSHSIFDYLTKNLLRACLNCHIPLPVSLFLESQKYTVTDTNLLQSLLPALPALDFHFIKSWASLYITNIVQHDSLLTGCSLFTFTLYMQLLEPI